MGETIEVDWSINYSPLPSRLLPAASFASLGLVSFLPRSLLSRRLLGVPLRFLVGRNRVDPSGGQQLLMAVDLQFYVQQSGAAHQRQYQAWRSMGTGGAWVSLLTCPSRRSSRAVLADWSRRARLSVYSSGAWSPRFAAASRAAFGSWHAEFVIAGADLILQ